MTQGSPLLAAALFLALLATALALGPALAHLFEMPNKMRLAPSLYFEIQQIYSGWAFIAMAVLILQAVGIIATAVFGREDSVILIASLVALAALIGAQAIFWVWTYPVNLATSQWTEMPENLDELRVRWEYSHAAGAVLQLVAMGSLSFAAASVIWRGSSG
jgi:hypothetical protein